MTEKEGSWFHYLRTGKTYQQEEKEKKENDYNKRIDLILNLLIVAIVVTGIVSCIMIGVFHQ